MKKLLLFALAALSISVTTNAQQFLWGKGAISNIDVATDRAGNVYTAGLAAGSGSQIDVDLSTTGVAMVNTSMSGMFVPYVVKYNAQGTVLWARSINAVTYDDENLAIAVDDAQNVFIVGLEDLDPFDVVRRGYVTKINANGTTAWQQSWGGTSWQNVTYCSDVAVDSIGNVYVTGYSNNSADLDSGSNVVAASGKFTVKLTTTGQYVWHALKGSALVEVTRDGNAVYAAGPVLNYGFPSTISKLDVTGAVIWNKNIDSMYFKKLNVTEAGKLYATGFFVDTIDADPGAGVSMLTTAGGNDQFLMKMDTAGTFIWATQLGSNALDMSTGLVVDGDGHIYTTGVFCSTVDMDNSTAVNNLVSTTPDTTDIFVQKLDTAGNYIWAVSIGTGSPNYSYNMAVDTAGAIFVIGSAYGADINPGVAPYFVNTGWFITKWSDTVAITSANTITAKENKVAICPNPSSKTINISAEQAIDHIIVTDVAGRTIYTATPHRRNVVVDILTPGMYFINITSSGNTSRSKVLIQ